MVGPKYIRPSVPSRYRMENTMPADVSSSPSGRTLEYMSCSDVVDWTCHHSVDLHRLSIERIEVAGVQVLG